MGNLIGKVGGGASSTRISQKSGTPRDGVMRGQCDSINSRYAVAWSQGFRPTMEDRHQAFSSLPADPDMAYFAVFDGHGGVRCSNYLSEELHGFISKSMDTHKTDLSKALQESFIQCDEVFLKEAQREHMVDGSTGNVLLINKENYVCANVGDTRSVLCRNGSPVALSRDHKPKDQDEIDRVKDAGGFVALGRVQGQLAVSRAFGDIPYKSKEKMEARKNKKYIVVAEPEIKIEPRQAGDEFIVMACDGLWDVMSNLQVTETVRKALQEKKEPQAIARGLVESAVLNLKSMDNVTVVVICFDQNKA